MMSTSTTLAGTSLRRIISTSTTKLSSSGGGRSSTRILRPSSCSRSFPSSNYTFFSTLRATAQPSPSSSQQLGRHQHHENRLLVPTVSVTNSSDVTRGLNLRWESSSSSSSSPPPLPPDDFSSTSTTKNQNRKRNNNIDYTKLDRLEDANPERIQSIIVNPESVGYEILPGNYVYKHFKFTGNIRKVPVELQHGFWWMVWDIKKCNNKPTLSNPTLVEESKAQFFPVLNGLTTLEGNKVDLPFSLLNNNNNQDGGSSSSGGGSGCTVVAISFRDYGYKFINTWTEPIVKNARDARVVKLSITERWSLYPLQSMLTKLMKQNTPIEEHSNSYLYFGSGSKIDDFRDVLRMHNVMTCYIFLVDEYGRIRFSASGPATEEESQNLIKFANELSSSSSSLSSSGKKATSSSSSPSGDARRGTSGGRRSSGRRRQGGGRR